MSKNHIIILLTAIIALLSCKDTNYTQSPKTTPDSTSVETSTPAIESQTLYAWVNKLRVRSQPDTKSEIIGELKEGEAVYYNNEKSDFTQKITLRGISYDEPWLKVTTEEGQTGWVYGGGLRLYAPKIDQAPSHYDNCMKLKNEGKYQQYISCYDKIQQKLLKKDNMLANQHKDRLRLRLLTGEFVTLDNILTESDDYVQFDYAYYEPKMSSYVVRTTYYEGGGYLLINDKSGKRTNIWGYPKPAPNHQHMVVTNADLVAGFEANGVQVLGFTGKGLEVIFEKELVDYQPVQPKWIDDFTAEIVMIPGPDFPGATKKMMTLQRTADGNWQLIDN